MKKLLFIALLNIFILLSAGAVMAQTDEEFDLVERATMVAEIKKLRSETAAKDVQISTLKEQIEVYKKLDAVQEIRIADLKESIKERTTANNIDVKVENLYKARIEDYQVETNRLREENENLRKSRDRRSLIFGVIGLLGG